MILDEIEKAYFRQNLMYKKDVELKISFDTYSEMLKQDIRVVNQGCPDEGGNLRPMHGCPVTIDHDLDCAWAWIVSDDENT